MDAIRAIQITSRYPAVHGAPVRVPGFAQIGIADVTKPDYGDAVTVRDDELPVSGLSRVTRRRRSPPKPPFAITIRPDQCWVHGP